MVSRIYDSFFGTKLSLATKILLSLAVLAVASWLGTSRGFYDTCVLNSFFSFSLAGFALIYFRLHPQWAAVLGVLGAAGLLTTMATKILHVGFEVYGVLGFLGLVSICAIALGAIRSAGIERKRLALAFLFAVVSVGSNAFAGFFHNWTSQFTPEVLDLYLISFDATLRVQFIFLVGQIYATWHWFAETGRFVYFGFPLVIALVFAGLVVGDKREARSATAAFLLTGPVGVIFYTLCPAIGPLYILGSRFPWRPLTLDQVWQLHLEPLALPGIRNAMPSLHVAWVLLAWWYSKGLSIWERSMAMFFLLVTLCATLGFGEHYLIDLVVAVPFALFIYALSAIHLPWSGGRRRMAVWLGLGTTLLWIALLRFNVRMFWMSPVIPWVACVATVLSAAMFQQYLARVPQEAPRPEPTTAPKVPAIVA